jgi:hypothetical protein
MLTASTYMTARCHNPDDHNLTTAVELPFKASFGSSGFKHETEENLKWREFNTKIINLGSPKLNTNRVPLKHIMTTVNQK